MNMWKFIIERFPLWVAIPLTAILCISALCLYNFSVIKLTLCFATVFMGLLILRAGDDICSIGTDRIKSPDRSLPSGRIDLNALIKAICFLVVLIIAINIYSFYSSGVWFILIVTAYYIAFYKGIKYLPILIKPLFSNIIFLCIPLYCSLISTNKITVEGILLGSFIYTAAIAHEYAHNAVVTEQERHGLVVYIDIIGSRGTAVLSMLCFIASFCCGMLFWLKASKPILFLTALIAGIIHIAFLELKVCTKPTVNNSRAFYIFGFTFFLLPLLGLIIDKLLL